MDYNQLLKDCLKQKPEAQKMLYEHFAPSMLGVCFRYTKTLNDAEEVLQEGFVKVFTRLNQFKGEGELGGWIELAGGTPVLPGLRRKLLSLNSNARARCPCH